MTSGTHARGLGDWVAAPAPPGEISTPVHLAYAALRWIDAPVPGTAAQALRAAGLWDLDHPHDFDAEDWWYRCTFRRPRADAAHRHRLQFGGLATLAEVWLNDRRILTSDSMFQTHRVDITDALEDANELVICFRALAPALARRRPRPRWKTRLVTHQQLRWVRTTLLGRMPGWSPLVAGVGPWRDVCLERLAPGVVTDMDVHTTLDGRDGVVAMSCWMAHPAEAAVSGALSVGGRSARLDATRVDAGYRLSARVRVEDAERWWPHTHGRPALYPCAAEITVNGSTLVCDAGAVGFRRVEAHRAGGGFALAINGTPIFCRGACWTVGDVVSLAAPPSALRRDLTLLQQAGANMVRVGGTMIYESDAFYRACDELGLLVWQDFMFANMDYPGEDEEFRQSVETEGAQQVRRLRAHPCVAVYCGNSEVEQQAAMMGAPREIWRDRLFSDVLSGICARLHPGVPYVPSTPSGGTLPFHTGTGLAHYYGVGAYRRPSSDVRRAGVRFAPECLGFSNVPEPDEVDRVMHGQTPAPHDPRWKQGVPRDTGAGWDFEDVRDHYVADLFGVDPARLRSADPRRYLGLGRVATGEMMARAFSEWRSGSSTCRGALVWFLKDLRLGAGWGILDSRGLPKACFYFLKRSWQPLALVMTDEGLDGIRVHAINETDREFSGSVELTLLQQGRVVIARGRVPCRLAPRDQAAFESDAILDGFHDVSYAYRFGPVAHDVVAATLYGEAGEIVGDACWLPDPIEAARPRRCGIVAEARPIGDGSYALTVTSDRFLFAARIDAPGYLPDENYFCLMPGVTKTVRLDPVSGGDRDGSFSGFIEAVNTDRAARIETTLRRLVTS